MSDDRVITGHLEWSIAGGRLAYDCAQREHWWLCHELTDKEVDVLRTIIKEYDQMHCDHEILGTGRCGRCDMQVTPFPGYQEAIQRVIEDEFNNKDQNRTV